MNAITTSIFELFKIGPGPSSSHTIGPMKAGRDFVRLMEELPAGQLSAADRIEIRLFGSLSATGLGHGTDRAIMAGLLGQEPETCESEFLDGLSLGAGRTYDVRAGDRAIAISSRDIIFDAVHHDFPNSNTMILRLFAGEAMLLEREYYSVGGGFLMWKGCEEIQRGEPVYPYENMESMRRQLRENDLRLHELILANETAISGMTEEEIYEGIDRIIEVMESSVERGLTSEGVLPGPIGVHRKAPELLRRSKAVHYAGGNFLLSLNAYAMAASEENAAGHRIVTAPTCGAAGVIPSVLYVLKHKVGVPQKDLRNGMLAAAAMGFLVKHNASIAGADVGCQGEVGTASAMAAAFIAYARGYRFQVTENAAEIALEHHLGLTCDPIGGYVQIPCIERNAMGAVKAYNAFLIATAEAQGSHKVDLDKAIIAMAETGRDMSRKYKETSEGGLALSMPEC